MNLENYTKKTIVAVQAIANGKFHFCCEATDEGIKACHQWSKEANEFLGTKTYQVVYTTTYIKTPKIEW